jgi:hypothetical protein
MNIALEARALTRGGGGVYWYTRELITHLLRLPTQHTFSIVYDSVTTREQFRAWPAQHTVAGRYGDFSFLLWQEWLMPRLLKRIAPDVVHFTKAAVPRSLSYPSIVTIYDIIPILLPASQTFLRRWYWPGALRQAAVTCRHIITISECSKRDIVKALILTRL